ncbi:MAG TPA: LON peptidase substrate-binding domain-containing protein [Gaiellaceae bacterium]|nr:LON peptidase substrate-binding domain-containing protein [Gaiellaceae bacterium]
MPEIGLFPLALVLTPTERVPLHIFEPRFKELIGECVADGTPFGLLLEDDEGRREVGTLAEVREVAHVFEDGRMNILVEGRERFRVAQWTDGRSYPTADVEPFEDEGAGPPDPAAAEDALGLFRKLAAVAEADIDEPDGSSGSLAFEIAAHVDFGTEPKQELIELRSETARLRRLAELLEHALTAMTREKEIRERAATNGRVSLG